MSQGRTKNVARPRVEPRVSRLTCDAAAAAADDDDECDDHDGVNDYQQQHQ